MANAYSSTAAIKPTVIGTKSDNQLTSPYTPSSATSARDSALSAQAAGNQKYNTTSAAYSPNATSTATNNTPSATLANVRAQGVSGANLDPRVGSAGASDASSRLKDLMDYYGDSTSLSYDFLSPAAKEEEPAVAPNALTSENAGRTQDYLDTYNADREQKIRDMYAGNTAMQQAQLKSAYDQNLSDMNANLERISPAYQQSMNALSAEFERQRRNNNMQAAVNGINTGTGSQMQLAQNAVYQGNQAALAARENEALNEANRGILDLKTNYQNRIAEAAASNNYQLAAALLDEYGAQYERTMQQASMLAEFGDFSMYAGIYGIEAAQQMEKAWAYQNPDLALNLGKITEEEYRQITGRGSGGYGGYGGSYSKSNSSSSYGLQKRIEDNMAKSKLTGQIAGVVGSGGKYVPKGFDAGAYGSTKFYGIPSGNSASSKGNSKERERVALKTYNANNK